MRSREPGAMTVRQINDELNVLEAKFREMREELEGGGMSGSPGEWMVERMGELETEMRRRLREPPLMTGKTHKHNLRLNEHADADLNAASETVRDRRSASSSPDPFANIADLAHMLAERDQEVRRLRSLVMAADREWALSERGSRITPGLYDAMGAVAAYCREWKT